MKTNSILITVLATLLPLAAFGQNPNPAPPAPPAPGGTAVPGAPALSPAPAVPAVSPRHGRMNREDRPREPVTFLGVETSHVPRALSEQLALPRGFGLVVDYIVPETGAAAAGLQESDILKMLNDQILTEPDQLGKLVRSFPEGTTVTFSVLRKGQEMKVPVTLKKRQPKARHDYGMENDWDFNFDGLDSLKDMRLPDMATVREAVTRAKKEALRAGDQARRAARRLRVVTTDDGTVRASHVDLGKAKIVYSDEKGELRLESVNGVKMLTARDASGKVLFNGPIDTKEQRAAIPPEVRKRYEILRDQDLPAVPPEPAIAPIPPDAPEPNETALLCPNGVERAALRPGNRSGWARSTMLL